MRHSAEESWGGQGKLNGAPQNYDRRVWVRRDLVEQVLNNRGKLPSDWTPVRKRTRSGDSWLWIKAQLLASSSSSSGVHSSTSSPYGQVRLRRTSPSSPSSVVANNHPVTILIDDVDAKELNNQTITLEANQKENQDPIILVANSWWQTGVDPPEDLTQLNHLHEPAVVLCLRKRYERNQIYTYTGKILIALNPFKQIRDLYGRSVIEHYLPSTLSSGGDSKAPPHVYATAQDAYSSMMQDKKNQSILVSGESGAGKTVTTKIVLAYLTIVSTWNQREGEKVLDGASGAVPSIESQVVHSTPILESFGNARTVRNDNSSRFGKFIDVRFLQSGKLQSASIQTYLLEKVRLISQAPGERNFHVFFELLNGLSQRERKDFLLGNLAPQDFRMTSNSGTFDRRDGVDDRATYRSLRESLSTIGLSASETKDVFSVCCALLFCSNLTFLESASGETELDNSNHSLSSVVELLGVDVLSLNNALCFTAIEARGETLYKTLSRSQASKALEALMKAAYSALFQYIVSRINDSISHEKGSNRRDAGLLSIGVLDIFGFESFDKNSFEQLCINFCNEHLQQQFNQFVFKEEQREYQQEGIEWKYISFPDNQDVLDLIEKKHEGIISVLNEQNLLPRCTDQSFCMAVYEKCSSHSRFHATKGQRIAGQFCIAHYAGDVEYSTTGFLEKNKDELPKETTDLFKSSTSRFIVVLGEILDSPSSLRLQEASVSNKKIRRSSSSLVRESVSSQFCSQLRELRAKIDATSPHYIRCFKPNDLLVPTTFVASVVADQLRCAGVLEAIRVSRVGFPHRFSFSQFTLRYQMLAKNHMPRHRRFYSERDLCEVVVNAVSLLIRRSHEIQLPKNPSAETDPSKNKELRVGIQMGRTKVFMRRFAFEILELLCDDVMMKSIIRLQAAARRFVSRSRFKAVCFAVMVLQRFARRLAAALLVATLHRTRAATIIQAQWRGFSVERYYFAAVIIAQWSQRSFRGMMAREICALIMLERKIERIQRAWRRHHSRAALKKCVDAATQIQLVYRCSQARTQLKALRLQARDVVAVSRQRDRYRDEALLLRRELSLAKTGGSPLLSRNRMEEERDVELLRKEIHDLQQQLARLEGHRSPMQRLGSQMRTIYESKFGNGSSNRVELDNAIDSMDNIPPQYTTDMSIQGTPRSLLDSHEYFSPTKSRKGRPAGEVSDCSTPEALPSNDNEYRKVGENDQNSRQADPVLELHEAVLIGELQRVRELLRQSYDSQRLANECTLTGMSPLHLAVKTGRLHLVKTLLEFGAAANCQDPNGNTPLHISPSSEITALLLEVGRANPNMPDAEGRCALHYAVRRLDIASVQHFVRFKLEVNMADNTDWQTPLHWAARMLVPQSVAQARAKIADLLCSASADVNAQDKDGNTALHHTVILESQEACDVLEILLNAKADPNIMNAKQQTPLHLLLHNDGLRNLGVLQEMLHNLLHFGANPNLWTRTGCTPLHLCLYHRDVDSAVQLASRGAELHLSVWKKPQRWEWDGGTELLAIDMVSDNHDLHRILAAISKPQKWAPNRPWCMHCKEMLGSFARAMHCRHCGRFVCGGCLVRALPPTYFPKSFEIYEQAWVCVVCEEILVSRRQGGGDDDASVTQPTTSLLDENASRASF